MFETIVPIAVAGVFVGAVWLPPAQAIRRRLGRLTAPRARRTTHELGASPCRDL